MTDVLVVSGEPLWPAVHGGRVRAARMVEQLARALAVRVVAPVEDEPPFDVPLVRLGPPARPPLVAAVAAPAPRLGQALLAPDRRAVLMGALADDRPAAVLFVNGYVAAMVPLREVDVPVAVDFHDLQVRRLASFARSGRVRSRVANAAEAVKARRWEPAVARRARLCTAVSDDDVALLRRWGGRALLVPNGMDPGDTGRSPADGPVTLVAGFGYAPNDAAARFLLDRVWPLVRESAPGVRLRIVGRRASSLPVPAGVDVEVVSDPVDVEPFYREAAVVVAPVRGGGGAQLKVIEALARGRLVVATPFSARSAPPSAGAAVEVTEDPAAFAAAVVRLWRDTGLRWAREQALAEASPVPTWEEACAPLVEALDVLVR